MLRSLRCSTLDRMWSWMGLSGLTAFLIMSWFSGVIFIGISCLTFWLFFGRMLMRTGMNFRLVMRQHIIAFLRRRYSNGCTSLRVISSLALGASLMMITVS